MKIEYKGQFFYVRTGPEYASELPAEEFVGMWCNIDDTKRIDIFYTSQVIGVSLYPDLLEAHLYVRGRKTPKQYKFADVSTYEKYISVLQSGLSFDLM